jgi:8-oxo-dGTP diphosphatase
VAIFDQSGRVLLIKENYGRHRYGLPGGLLEPGETPTQVAVREAREETGVEVVIDHLVGVYSFTNKPHLSFVFGAKIIRGLPSVPSTGEIAAVAWFDPERLPAPMTFVAPHAIRDEVRGARGVVRGDLIWQ